MRAADGLAVEEVEVVERRRGRRVALCRIGRRLFRMERMMLCWELRSVCLFHQKESQLTAELCGSWSR